ncbi:hypothetical protein EJB05_23658, partial [Eragrostis curvula]
MVHVRVDDPFVHWCSSGCLPPGRGVILMTRPGKTSSESWTCGLRSRMSGSPHRALMLCSVSPRRPRRSPRTAASPAAAAREPPARRLRAPHPRRPETPPPAPAAAQARNSTSPRRRLPLPSTTAALRPSSRSSAAAADEQQRVETHLCSVLRCVCSRLCCYALLCLAVVCSSERQEVYIDVTTMDPFITTYSIA